MSLNNYLETKRRNRARKELRKQYPNLMGQQLEDKVDRVLGIADTGKMDWTKFVDNNSKTSDYPTPDSVKYEDVVEIAKEFRLRPYALYWFYLKKIAKLTASGRDKTNYKALLKELAPGVIGKELDFDTKIVAATIYAKDLKDVMITRQQAEAMIMEGKL